LPESEIQDYLFQRRGWTPETVEVMKTRRNKIQALIWELFAWDMGTDIQERAKADLEAHPELWTAMVAGTYGCLRDHIPLLLQLRDLPTGHWHARTMYISATHPGAEDKLNEMSLGWEADEFDFYVLNGERRRVYLGDSRVSFVARVWWD
jgi:hypothetical protein